MKGKGIKMARLIDADYLWMEIICKMDYCDDILELIESAPTIDAVPVVRCGKCKWAMEWGAENNGDKLFRCMLNAGIYGNRFFFVKGEEFCSYGERRSYGME